MGGTRRTADEADGHATRFGGSEYLLYPGITQ